MVNSADLENVVRNILEEVISASNRKKDETLLSVSQASALLNVNRSTLWSWEKKGYLKPIRIGRKVRYSLSKIKSFISGDNHE